MQVNLFFQNKERLQLIFAHMNAIEQNKAYKAVATWIFIGVAMLVIQVVLGGVTRLTGSGLSITKWDIFTGTLPPLNEQKWIATFEAYKQTAQYKLLNYNFTLSDFKFIFFWEWFHRLWARLIAVVFIVGFIYLWRKKYLKNEMIAPLLTLFAMGALQGAIGWIMVMSGLTGDAVYVAPVKLSIHFVFALLLICYAFWVGLIFIIKPQQRMQNNSIHSFIKLIIFMVFIQLVFGAFMAGHKAAPYAASWPDINGSLVPSGMWSESPVLINLIENKILIHFIHRMLAYLLFILIAVLSYKLYRNKFSAFINRVKWIPMALVIVQLLLGIFTVLNGYKANTYQWDAFEWMAQLHQIVAIFLILSLTALLYLIQKKSI